jgi:hypothetical protein
MKLLSQPPCVRFAVLLPASARSVDLFICPNSYVDVATIGVLASNTCGQVNMYPNFHARKDGESLQNDLCVFFGVLVLVCLSVSFERLFAYLFVWFLWD